MLGEPMLLMADPMPAVPAAEIAPRAPDPGLRPISVGDVDIPPITPSEMELIEDEFEAINGKIASLTARLVAIEETLVKQNDLLAKISRVLIRKLGTLD